MNLPLYFKLAPLTLAISMGLSACGGGGGSSNKTGDDVNAVEVNGIAEAPGGAVAQLEYHQSFMVAAIEYIFPGAYAAITGLDPVTGATVELIRVDNDGNQVGDVLASTVTSITGEYSLALPTGVDFSGDLVLRITGNGGSSMSAQVVEQSVDINPISQYILDKFIEDGTALADLPVNDVVALTGKVEEFDLTADPGSNLETMLNQLESQVGTFVDNQITVINSTPGDGASVAGNWRVYSYSAGLHDSDGKNYGTYAYDINSSTIAIADAGSGDINITESGSESTWTNASTDGGGGTFSLYVESDIGSGPDSFPASIDSDGNIAVDFPFEEELETVDTNLDADGPDYGWRWPPGTFFAEDTGNGNIKLAVNQDAGVRYLTTDTNSDGVKDAIDPAQKDGDEVSIEMTFIVKEGSGMDVSSLSGDYGMVSYDIDISASPEGILRSEVGPIAFDGSGNLTVGLDALEEYQLARTPATPPAVNLAFTASPTGDGGSLSYTVGATGAFEVASEGIQGQVSDDGSIIIAQAHSDDAVNNEAGNSVNSMRVFVKSTSGMVKADLANSSYALRPLIQGADDTGYQSIFTLSSGSTLVFDATGDNVTITPSDRGIERSSDTGEVEAIAAETPQAMAIPVAAFPGDGSISITANDDSIDIDGYVTPDKSLFIGRLYIDEGTSQTMGLVVGIKQ